MFFTTSVCPLVVHDLPELNSNEEKPQPIIIMQLFMTGELSFSGSLSEKVYTNYNVIMFR